MTKRSVLVALAAICGLVLLYLLLWPVAVDPAAWTPPAAPALVDSYAVNTRLSATRRIGAGAGQKPEEPAFDAAGRLYAGMLDGRIVRFKADGTQPEVFATTGGRPLGLKFDRAGNLLVADADKGLLAINPAGTITVLTTAAAGRPFRCPNDLDIAADGTIFFSDASDKFPLAVYKNDILEHRPHGRLLAYDPATHQTRVLLADLYFANGVAVSPDQTFVLVVDTGLYRVRRVWLAGARQGQTDVFIDNLPGFPDNIASNGVDGFWLALVTPRNKLLDRLLPHPFLRRVVARLPDFLQPAPERYGFVLKLDPNGRVVANLQDPTGRAFAQISSVLEHDGQLYFGSIGEDAIGRLTLTNGPQQ